MDDSLEIRRFEEMQLVEEQQNEVVIEGDAGLGVVDVVILEDQPQQAPEMDSSSRSGEIPYNPEDDDLSDDIREYSGVFEGPEKTLEVFFRKIPDEASEEAPVVIAEPGQKLGLRQLSRPDLDRICKRARCTILSSMSNSYLDAYVLSESSLFVYPYMVVIKTCGTTTLLRCVATLIELGRTIGLEIDWVGYSRKNFNFPEDQAYPHHSFSQELDYLYSHRNLCERLRGNGYTLGPVTADHWFVFVADQTIRSKNFESDTDRVLNIMMFDIDEDVAETFYFDKYDAKSHKDETDEEAVRRISHEQTKKAGIDRLCPGAMIDPRAFEPCGYSMNAILYHSYYTMHITPEDGSSYASFETNQKVTSYTSLINNVVRTFRPKRFVMTLMADEGGLMEMSENPLTGSSLSAKLVVPSGKPKVTGKASLNGNITGDMIYKRSSLASINVEDDCRCMMGNWEMEEDAKADYIRELRSSRARGMSVS
eukprot:scaffold78239_cov46-Attheya_sp.AAC.3